MILFYYHQAIDNALH